MDALNYVDNSNIIFNFYVVMTQKNINELLKLNNIVETFEDKEKKMKHRF